MNNSQDDGIREMNIEIGKSYTNKANDRNYKIIRKQFYMDYLGIELCEFSFVAEVNILNKKLCKYPNAKIGNVFFNQKGKIIESDGLDILDLETNKIDHDYIDRHSLHKEVKNK